jgi:hypothetical protein
LLDWVDLVGIELTTSSMPWRRLKFHRMAGRFAVCRLPADSAVPEWASRGPFTSITRSSDELSIVCPQDDLPLNQPAGPRWIGFRLEGPFAFSEVGVLASFIAPLAAKGVPIFAISTFNTDYVLVSEEFAGAALTALQAAGHELVSAHPA